MLLSYFTILKGTANVFQGLYDATGPLTQLDDASEGDYWIVNVASGGLLVNDQLVAINDVTGTPANLDDFFAVSYSVQNMQGATGVANGVQGIIPAPLAGQQNQFLDGGANWRALIPSDISISSGAFDAIVIPGLSAGKVVSGIFDEARLPAMVGATDVANGEKGAVPEPQAGDEESWLNGAGDYQNPNTYDYSDITLAGNVITSAGQIAALYVKPSTEKAFVPQATVNHFITGFDPVVGSTISTDVGTRTFTIAPIGDDYPFWVQGTQFDKTSGASKIWPDTSGIKTFFFDASGDIQVFDGAIDDGSDPTKCVIASLYWNASTQTILVSLADQRHTIIWPTDIRYADDEVNGTQWVSGMNPSGFTFGDGTLDIHAQFEILEGIHRDADLRITSAFVPSVAGLKIVHLDSGGTDLTQSVRAGFSFLSAGTGRAAYDLAGVQTEATDNYYVLCHLATGNAGEIYSVQGRAEYETISGATSAATAEWLDLKETTIAGHDIRPIGSVILQTSDSYVNTVLTRCVQTVTNENFVDVRKTVQGAISGSISGTDVLIDTGDFTDQTPINVQLLGKKVDDLGVFGGNLLTDDAIISSDLALGDKMYVTLTDDRVLENPSNVLPFSSWQIELTQDATGTRLLTFDSYYLWSGGLQPTLSTSPDSVDILTCSVFSDITRIHTVFHQDSR